MVNTKNIIILLFLLDKATLMVTFKREEICALDFSFSKLTSFNHSSVSIDNDWTMVSTNISSVMTRKYDCLVKREKSFFRTLICEISPVFWSMGQKRKLWKPGLKKWLSSVFITWNCFKEGETGQAKHDRSKITQKRAQRNEVAMSNL